MVQNLAQKAQSDPKTKSAADAILSLVQDVQQQKITQQDAKERVL
jgi:hypothetical protein